MRNIPNFKGPFFTWKVSLSTNREKSLQELLLVFSSGKRDRIHRYLWHKMVWDQLSKDEFLLFISMSETLGNDKIVGFLRAKLEVPLKVLRYRLNKIESLLGEKETDYISYLGYRRIRLDIQRIERKLPKVKKFSGYVKNIASLGKGSRGSSVPEPSSKILDFVENLNDDWYYLLSVGELTLLSRELQLPDEDQKVRNGGQQLKTTKTRIT